MFTIRNIENLNGFNGWKFVRIDKDDVDSIDKLKEEGGCSNCKVIVNNYIVKDIVAYGKCDSDDSEQSIYDFLKLHVPFIEKRPVGTSINSKERVKMYHCFAGHTIESQLRNNVIIHEDIKSSINCLLTSLKNPEYVLIFI